jgi:hypothetical protein
MSTFPTKLSVGSSKPYFSANPSPRPSTPSHVYNLIGVCLSCLPESDPRLLLPLLLEEPPRLPIIFTIPCCMTELLCLRFGKCEITARHRFQIRRHIYWDGCHCLDLDIIRSTNTVVSVVEVWCSLERGPSNGNAFECKFGKHQSNGKWKNFNQYYSELELERSREWSLLSG